MTLTLPLFGSENAEQPVPLEVAALYHFPLQYHTLADDTLVYAVQDWIAGVGQTSEPRKMWSDARRGFKQAGVELSDSIVQLAYLASNGKTYQMDYANEVTLYQIAQRMRPNTGIRNEVLEYLAKSGAFVSLMRVDQEAAEIEIGNMRRAKALKKGRKQSPQKGDKTPEWVMAREIGIVTRKQFVALLTTLNANISIGRATNEVYEGTLGTNADGLRSALNLGKSANPRDYLSEIALAYTMVTEASCRIQLADLADGDIVSTERIHRVIVTISRAVGVQADQWARTLGIDLITGRKLLS